jgi:hypothetical protein
MRLLNLHRTLPPGRDAKGSGFLEFALILEAFVQLLRFDPLLTRGNFSSIYERVRRPSFASTPIRANDVQQICSAIDLASVYYWRRILCLQRSAATASLLKRFGIPAQMVIGIQHFPFRAHAWVEIEGRVVSDKPDMHAVYEILDRC